jgi:Domain of Unknown Function (DUF928)
MTYLNRISTMAALFVVAASGATAQAIGFQAPPGQGTPSQATGGASRGGIKFAPARGMRAPSQATGGASRGAIKFAPARGQGAPNQATGGASRGSVFFKPAKGQSAPLRASGGASRTGRYDLIEANAPTGAAGPAAVMAMLPQTYMGNTISDRPTIMVYMPASAARQASFSLKDAQGKTLYQRNLAVSGNAEVMALALPADAPALQVGQTYQWYVGLQVDGDLGPSTPYVDGWIQRVEPSAKVAAALQQSDLLKQAEVLGAEGVWYDCAAKLANLRAQSPGNAMLDKEWSDLLGAVGLQELGAMPVVAAVQ